MSTPTEPPRPRTQRNAGGGWSGFNGQLLEPRTGHYLLGSGYRAYNPVLMHFNNPDALSPFARGGLNAYAYCLGDPVNLLDPDGRAGWLMTQFRKLFRPFSKTTPPKALPPVPSSGGANALGTTSKAKHPVASMRGRKLPEPPDSPASSSRSIDPADAVEDGPVHLSSQGVRIHPNPQAESAQGARTQAWIERRLVPRESTRSKSARLGQNPGKPNKRNVDRVGSVRNVIRTNDSEMNPDGWL